LSWHRPPHGRAGLPAGDPGHPGAAGRADRDLGRDSAATGPQGRRATGARARPARHSRYAASRGLRRSRPARGGPDAPARARHPARRSGAAVARAAPPVSKRAASESTKTSVEHRAGFVSLIGRPNAGKSTLLNRLVGQKLAIVSSRPQTTRNRITGILTRPDAQAVFVDTPGLHVGGGKLGAFMQQTARRAMEDVDVVCLVVDATGRTDPDDLVLEPLRAYGGPAVCALNKTDLVAPKAALLPLLDRWRTAHDFQALVPISATDGINCDRLLDLLLGGVSLHPAPR